jgi:outer membrane murein-binding lipoprotein Lpp
MKLRRVLAVTLSAMLVAGGAVAAKAVALESERATLVAQATQLNAEVAAAEARGDYLQDAIDLAEDESDDLAALLEVRPGFVVELKDLAAALERAGGRIDTASLRVAALAAQQTVLDEREDPAVVTNATATVHALVAKVNDDVVNWEASQVQLAGGPRWSSGGADDYTRVRAALDLVGGAGIGLYESTSCAGGTAAACANSNGYIKYTAAIATWSDDRLHWAMAHELAHIYQFRVWGSLNASASYRSMFGADPEFLANCMAVVRGYPGSVGCDGGQQAWASGIWVGAVG